MTRVSKFLLVQTICIATVCAAARVLSAQTPVVTAVSPATLTAGAGPQTVSVTGTGFVPGLTVYLTAPSGQVLTYVGSAVTGLTPTSFQLAVTASVAGSYRVMVVNPVVASNSVAFTAAASAVAAPKITGITPASITATTAPTTLAISGTGFAATGMTLVITTPNGAQSPAAVTVASATSAQTNAVFPTVGAWTLTVRNPDGQQGAATVNVTAPGAVAPRITATTPSIVTVGTATVPLTITGTGFAATGMTLVFKSPSGVQFPAVVTVTSANSAQTSTVFPTPGTWTLTVTNPDGQQGTALLSAATSVTAPTITSINPAAPVAGMNYSPFSVIGTGFAQGMVLTFTPASGGTPATVPAAVSSATAAYVGFVFTVPGPWFLSARNPDGMIATWTFTVGTPELRVVPAITSVTPVAAAPAAQPVTFTGAGFVANMQLQATGPNGVGQMPVLIPSLTSASSFTVALTLALPGQWTFTLRTPAGDVSQPFVTTVRAP